MWRPDLKNNFFYFFCIHLGSGWPCPQMVSDIFRLTLLPLPSNLSPANKCLPPHQSWALGFKPRGWQSAAANETSQRSALQKLVNSPDDKGLVWKQQAWGLGLLRSSYLWRISITLMFLTSMVFPSSVQNKSKDMSKGQVIHSQKVRQVNMLNMLGKKELFIFYST